MKYENPTRNVNSTELEMDNKILCKFVVNELINKQDCHPHSLDELMLMVATICRFKPNLILEWGTGIGLSSWIFYQTISQFDIDCKIYSIDLPDDVIHIEHPHEYRGKYVKDICGVKLMQGDGITCAIDIVKNKKDSDVVLFFVDGDHEYSSVSNELQLIFNYIPNAIILLHDTFYQSPDSKYNIGPHNAIQDFLPKVKSTHNVIQTKICGPGMTLIYPKTNL